MRLITTTGKYLIDSALSRMSTRVDVDSESRPRVNAEFTATRATARLVPRDICDICVMLLYLDITRIPCRFATGSRSSGRRNGRAITIDVSDRAQSLKMILKRYHARYQARNDAYARVRECFSIADGRTEGRTEGRIDGRTLRVRTCLRLAHLHRFIAIRRIFRFSRSLARERSR
jgi:hypothetical protein